MEQPDKDSGNESELQQVANDFCCQRVSTGLIVRVSTEAKNPVKQESERHPCCDEMPCPARLRLVQCEKNQCNENVDDSDNIEPTMENKMAPSL